MADTRRRWRSGPGYTDSPTDHRNLQVCDTETGNKIFTIEGHREGLLDGVEYSPDGLAIASFDGEEDRRPCDHGPAG